MGSEARPCTTAVAPLQLEVTGLNISTAHVAAATKRLQTTTLPPSTAVRVELGDATAMPFPSATFDAAVALECAFHMPPSSAAFMQVRHRHPAMSSSLGRP